MKIVDGWRDIGLGDDMNEREVTSVGIFAYLELKTRTFKGWKSTHNVLVVEQKDAPDGKLCWGLPAGRCEAVDGSDPRNTAVRELLEETGLHVGVKDLYFMTELRNITDKKTRVIYNLKLRWKMFDPRRPKYVNGLWIYEENYSDEIARVALMPATRFVHQENGDRFYRGDILHQIRLESTKYQHYF